MRIITSSDVVCTLHSTIGGARVTLNHKTIGLIGHWSTSVEWPLTARGCHECGFSKKKSVGLRWRISVHGTIAPRALQA
jgi:hypothetical protein